MDNFYNASEHVLDRLKTITGQHVCCYNVDVTDAAELDKVFASHSFDAVIHFAGVQGCRRKCGEAPRILPQQPGQHPHPV